MVVMVGETAEVRWDGAPAGAGSLTVTAPTGTTSSPAVTQAGGSSLSAQVAATVPGRHLLSWSAGTAKHVDVLDVWPADPRYLVAIADVAATLGRSASSPALHVAVATWIVESIAGPVLPVTKTWDGGRGAGVVVLPHVDVTNVGVKVDGVPWTGVPDVDEMAGIVSGLPTTGRVQISYSVGADLVPPPLRAAAHDIAVHLARSSRQATGVGQNEPAGDTVPTNYGFAIPRRAYELCQAAARRAPGFA